jgi:4-amino-4-deoxy-L-arabinose transferase-like glycosyltransferase
LRERLAVAVMTVLCLVPFSDKPFHLDDPFYVLAARQIREHPLDFYGFSLNWHGRLEPAYDQMKNPPATSYYLAAAAAALGGFDEQPLRLAYLPLSVAAALGVHALARRLCGNARLATALSLGSPIFLVTASNLGSDVPMLACWCWSVLLWMRGIDEGRRRWLAAAAALAALAALTKYLGAGLVPLLAAYAIARQRRVSPVLLWLLAPIAALAAYEAFTAVHYGTGLLAEAADFSLSTRNQIEGENAPPWLAAATFVGGGFAAVSLCAPVLWRRSTLVAGGLVTTALALSLVAAQRMGTPWLQDFIGAPTSFAVQLALLAVAGVQLPMLALMDLHRRRDADALLLFLSVAGSLTFAAQVNWTVNARSLVTLVSVAGILVVRRLEDRTRSGAGSAWRPAWVVAVAGLVLALLALRADTRHAWAVRTTAAELTRRYDLTGPRAFFLGHWGLQYYLEQAGAHAADMQEGRFAPGDILVVPENGSGGGSKVLPWNAVTVLGIVAVDPGTRISVMSGQARAGFYSAMWGPLPFRLGAMPPERTLVVRVERPLRGAGKRLVPDP